MAGKYSTVGKVSSVFERTHEKRDLSVMFLSFRCACAAIQEGQRCCSLSEASSCSYEPPRDKTNKMTFAPSEDSDRPGRPLSLIRVVTVRMKKAWALSYPLIAQ